MKYLMFVMLITILWTAYEIWRAPLMEETKDGGLKTKRPAKKFSDLWRKGN